MRSFFPAISALAALFLTLNAAPAPAAPAAPAAAVLPLPARAFATAFSPDGRYLAVGASDGKVRLLDGRTGKPLKALPFGGAVESVAFSPDSRLVSGAADNRVATWDVASGSKRWARAGGAEGAEALRFDACVSYAPDGNVVAVAARRVLDAETEAGAVALLDAHTGKVLRTLTAGAEPLNAVAVSPDGRQVAGVAGEFESEHPEIYLWNRETGAVEWSARAEEGPLLAVAFSPDGKSLAVAGRAASCPSAMVLDAASGLLTRTLDPGESVFSLAYAPDGHTLAAGGLNGSVSLWNADTGARRARYTGAASPYSVMGLSFAPDGKRLALASDEGAARLLDIAP